MSSQKAVVLKPLPFAKALLETEDLDPLYVMLHKSELGNKARMRWCFAYWMFYHAGVCSWIVEQKDFWGAVKAIFLEGCPRGMERRHFRGEKAWKAIEAISRLGEPEDIAYSWLQRGLTYRRVSERIQALPQFGPWIAWKIADMIERLFLVPIDFGGTDLFMYDEPRKGALLIGSGLDGNPKDIVSYVVATLLQNLSGFCAPPGYNRPINIQEVETVLCKYRAYFGGHYWVGKDIKDIGEALEGWGDLAEGLRAHLPEEVQ